MRRLLISTVLGCLASSALAAEPPASGDLAKDAVRGVIRAHVDELRSCYVEALRRKPGIEGKIVLGFIVAPSGAVTEVAVQSSTVDDPPLEQCVLGKAQSWRFPKLGGSGPVKVVYPFKFAPSDGKPPAK